MRAVSTTTTGGALISALAGVTAGTITKVLGAMMHHTTDANCVLKELASDGNNFATLKVVDEAEMAKIWFPGGLLMKDVYYTLSAGTLILYIE